MLTYLLIIITLYLAGNAYIFIRAKQALKVKSLGVKIFLTVLFWICALSFFGTMLTRNLEMPVFISHSMYTIGTSWLIFTLYMALFLLLINAPHPDLILISGDLIDNSVVPLYTENMAEELANLKAPMGIYMVLGNHEYISGIDESIRYIKSTQIQLLRDSVVTLPNGIQLIGRDDRHNRKRHSLQELMVNIDKSKPIILLDHQPFDLEKTEAAGIDLQFSGHTHHGQIWPINWVTDYIFEQSHGYRQWGNSHVYVSSGLSLWGPPFRIGTHSEMVIFNFQ